MEDLPEITIPTPTLTGSFDLSANMMKAALWYYLRPTSSGIHTEIDLPGRAGRADVIALDLLHRQVKLVEIKRSRGDFRRGLEKLPDYYDKAHECYLAAPPGIIPDSEIPPGWGMIEFGPTLSEIKLLRPALLHSCPAPFFDWYLRLILEKSRDNSFYGPALERAYARQVIVGPPKKETP